jgi:CHAT domain-containing protein
VDEVAPDRSAILLAAGPADGLLQVPEISGLTLQGQVVVLSACRSVSGTVIGGEGPWTLSRAFLEAGARVVVGTTWAIRDDHAARFFDPFYRELARGQPVGAAVRSARREAMAAGLPASVWASVVVVGDDTARIAATQDGREHWWLVPLAAATVLACGAGWAVRR